MAIVVTSPGVVGSATTAAVGIAAAGDAVEPDAVAVAAGEGVAASVAVVAVGGGVEAAAPAVMVRAQTSTVPAAARDLIGSRLRFVIRPSADDIGIPPVRVIDIDHWRDRRDRTTRRDPGQHGITTRVAP
jgi:hypothetical protein